MAAPRTLSWRRSRDQPAGTSAARARPRPSAQPGGASRARAGGSPPAKASGCPGLRWGGVPGVPAGCPRRVSERPIK
ncbi:Hypothetical predicted protein [Marmota monax]|uniref:Uncharacterized protein n=1 Tax=Marmota monax TaxID=9995 RepID=A0A5E4A5H3_MARMO|nr:Hypothetical predicted protein [Marmota monax]